MSLLTKSEIEHYVSQETDFTYEKVPTITESDLTKKKTKLNKKRRKLSSSYYPERKLIE